MHAVDKKWCLMTSLGKGQTVMALTDPSTLWTPNELQVLQQLFRMTLPHKNQSAQIYWEGFGVMGKYVYACVLVSLSTSLFVWSSGWWMLQKNRNLPRKSFDVLTHYHSSPRSFHPFQRSFFHWPMFNRLDYWTWTNGKLFHEPVKHTLQVSRCSIQWLKDAIALINLPVQSKPRTGQ